MIIRPYSILAVVQGAGGTVSEGVGVSAADGV
jgi:hypothetical protein